AAPGADGELISELGMPSAEPAGQAREVDQARDGCGCYSGYSEDTAIDNVSSPKPKTRGVYSEDTQTRAIDNGGSVRLAQIEDRSHTVNIDLGRPGCPSLNTRVIRVAPMISCLPVAG